MTDRQRDEDGCESRMEYIKHKRRHDSEKAT